VRGMPSAEFRCAEDPMLFSSFMRDQLRLPRKIALLLGLGALSAAGVKADTGEVQSDREPARVPQQSTKTFGDLLIWTEGPHIYVAESERGAGELPLGDTLEARRLRELLAREGATAESPRTLRDSIILVGAGGEGFHWESARHSNGPGKPAGSKTRPQNKRTDRGRTPPSEKSGTPETHGMNADDAKKNDVSR
jgi:hypothetical protein